MEESRSICRFFSQTADLTVCMCLCAGMHVFEICSYSTVFRVFLFVLLLFFLGGGGDYQLVEAFRNVGSLSSNNRSPFLQLHNWIVHFHDNFFFKL